MPIRILVILAVLTGANAAFAAQTDEHQRLAATDPSPTQLSISEPLEQPKSQQEMFLNEVLTQITARKAASKKSEQLTKRLDKLGSLYSHPDATSYWTTDSARQVKLHAIRSELENAAYWGLNAKAFRFPKFNYLEENDLKAQAKYEIDISLVVLKYAEHAFGGRVDPTKLSLWLNRAPRRVDALKLIPLLANAKEPEKVLQSLHPKHREFSVLLQAYRERVFPDLHPGKKTDRDIIIPRGSRIRVGDRHPHIGLIRRRLEMPVVQGTDIYDKPLANKVAQIMRKNGWKKYRKTRIDKWVRRVLNKAPLARKKAVKAISVRKLVINMDRWRRMPSSFRRLHIRNNLPSYETKLFRDKDVIHKERIIVGKTNTQTPVFSDRMDYVVFKPNWGVPSSIKIRQLLPRLRGGDYSVLSRRGMRIVGKSGRTLSPRRFNWNRVSISDIPIYQDPGPRNPLGQVKFMFPNKHAVYMHDTPKKYLFKNKARAFSHGCIRVRNPKRLAEILFEEIHGWDKPAVHANFHRKAKGNNRIVLDEKVGVHNTYFTLAVTDDGEILNLKDIYGHDRRITRAMNGESAKRIAYSDPARAQKAALKQIVKGRYAIAAKRVRLSNYNQGPNYIGGPKPKPFFFKPAQAPGAKKKKKKKYYKSSRFRSRPQHRYPGWTPF